MPSPSDPYQAFNFRIEIEGITAGGFSECSGLQIETEFYEYQEGGVNEYTHRLIGQIKYQPLTLKHGLTDKEALWKWYEEVIKGIESGNFKRRNGTITLLDREKKPVLRWNFKKAYPYKWIGPEFRADSGNVGFESVELIHCGLSQSR